MAETADAALGEAEYRAIEATFGETARGRLFLAEFARRSRKADVDALMVAMERLEQSGPSRPDEKVEGLKALLAEIAALLEDAAGAQLPSGFETLAAALRDAESATSDVLDAAEHIQEIAWTLRERGADRGICDLLDGRSSGIYAACALHDAAVKRLNPALRRAHMVEERIAALCDAWGVRRSRREDVSSAGAGAEEVSPAPGQEAGPAEAVAAEPADPPAEPPEEAGPANHTPDPVEEVPAPADPLGEEPIAALDVPEPPPPVEEHEAPPEADPAAKKTVSPRRRRQIEALAEIDGLGIREKLKLFT